MKRTVIAHVSPPKGAFLTIKKDGSVGYKNKKTGRRVVLTKIKRREGHIYFADGAGKVYEQVSTFGKKSAAKKGAAKGSTKRRAKKSAKKTAKRATKKRSTKISTTKKTGKRSCKRCAKKTKRGTKRAPRPIHKRVVSVGKGLDRRDALAKALRKSRGDHRGFSYNPKTGKATLL